MGADALITLEPRELAGADVITLNEHVLGYAGAVDVVGTYTFTFGDTTVNATLPINDSYQYDFNGTYEVFSGTILISWDHGEQMHLDYTFDGTTLVVVEFGHDR